jgi:hypothetical protein
MADSNHRRTTGESQLPADQRRSCGGAKGRRAERGHEGRDLGAASTGVERARDRSPTRAPTPDGESLSGEGGRHPPATAAARGAVADPRRARGDLARDRPRALGARDPPALGRSHTTIARELNRCGGRRRYRAHTADREAWRRSRRPRPTKLELCPEPRRAVEERLKEEDHSPERIAGWLRLRCPDNEEMRVSHETIYRALYVQARGTLRRELTRHLRRGRSRR